MHPLDRAVGPSARCDCHMAHAVGDVTRAHAVTRLHWPGVGSVEASAAEQSSRTATSPACRPIAAPTIADARGRGRTAASRVARRSEQTAAAAASFLDDARLAQRGTRPTSSRWSGSPRRPGPSAAASGAASVPSCTPPAPFSASPPHGARRPTIDPQICGVIVLWGATSGPVRSARRCCRATRSARPTRTGNSATDPCWRAPRWRSRRSSSACRTCRRSRSARRGEVSVERAVRAVGTLGA